MLKQSTLTFIGSGAMGEAMVHIALDRQLVQAQQITASDIRPERCQELEARYGIRVTTDNAGAVRGADVVVLAVKPQVLTGVLGDLKARIQPTAVVLSIVAGARLSTLVEGLAHPAIVRSMPNTPAQIGEGMTVWTATGETSAEQRQKVETLLTAMGQALYVHEEKYLDMATAISGSGPAYIFLMLEALVDAGVYLGFSRPAATQLVLQTMRGSVLFAAQSDKHLAELRNMVTSPGGTTAEALQRMEKGALRAVLCEAIEAAYQKSRLLADVK